MSGYRYDTETELYYLQSRYYNPEWERFINADTVERLRELVSTDNELADTNLFAYCGNNPIMREDNNGDFWQIELAGGGALGASWSFGGANIWNPVGWAVLGTCAVVTVGFGIHYFATHRTTKNGSKTKTNNKHTTVRSGSQKNKAKKSKTWNYKGNKKGGPTDYTP